MDKDLLSKAYNLKKSGATWQFLEDNLNIKVRTLVDNLLKEGFDLTILPKNKKIAGKVRPKIKKEEIDLAFKLKKEGKTMDEISIILQKPKYTLRSLGVHKINRIVDRRQVYPTNINYFDKIDTEDKAYFLGLIAADGSIDNSRLRIELQKEDQYILEMFRDIISPEHPIYINKRVNRKETATLDLSSVYWVNKLKYLHIIPRKSFCNTSFPDININMIPHFIRGYFDGDGSVYIDKKTNDLRIKFIGNTLFITELLNVFVSNLDITPVKLHNGKKYQDYTSYFSIARKKDVINLYDYMYQNSTYFLNRKKKIFDRYYLLEANNLL